MDKLIASFPQNILESLEIASNIKLRPVTNTIQNIVVCGMGGSGIGGKLVSQWLENELQVPFQLVQDYSLPNFVNENTLLIGSSYSGNTEETLYSLQEGKKRGAHIIGICSGGTLASFCADNNYDCILVPGGNPPRTALAFSLGQLLQIFQLLGLASSKNSADFKESSLLLSSNENSIKEEGKKLAAFLKDKFVMIYAASNYEAVAIRARQQFNENGKILCCTHTIPEMNHNELVGWGLGNDSYGALFLESEDWFDRNLKRLEFSKKLIATKTKHIFTLTAKGNSIIERSLYFIHVVDWSSFYLSELNNVDAFEIDCINNLKEELSNF